jgi:pyruvate dehydrogenase E2 component (dihydrolipoamide acetyltransferase)
VSELIEVQVPDLGDVHDVPIIEVLVRSGDRVQVDTPLVVLESDKATMDVPSPAAGTVRELRAALGDKVSRGTVILVLATGDGIAHADAPDPASIAEPARVSLSATTSQTVSSPAISSSPESLSFQASPVDSTWGQQTELGSGGAPFIPYCGPAVRRLARELGVNLAEVKGSGTRGRLLKEDVLAFVKQSLSGPRQISSVATAQGIGFDMLPWPKVDFAKFGPVERCPLSRIQKLSGANLARNWIRIPHVTSFDEADITDLEEFRQRINQERKGEGVRLTPLAYLLKVSAAALKAFPQFNASLDGEEIVLKSYVHIGFAVDTPNGLVVPVIRDVDRKGVIDIAREAAALAERARAGQLKADEMQGGSFTISSLGSIGGTAFTPIINAPEVAILGVTPSAIKPVWDGDKFIPRKILPLSLSWDHRVIDGVAAARFNGFLTTALGDFRRLIL